MQIQLRWDLKKNAPRKYHLFQVYIFPSLGRRVALIGCDRTLQIGVGFEPRTLYF